MTPAGSMQWILAVPFLRDEGGDWIPRHVGGSHRFATAPAPYDHDRSRAVTGAAEWSDYLRHAWSAWRLVRAAPRGGAGVMTGFPQLAVTAALVKLVLGRRDVPLVAWCFNLGRTPGGWKARLARAVLGQVDVFVVHSRREVGLYADWLALPRDRFVFVPLSIHDEPRETHEDAAAPFVLAMGSANRDYATLVAAVARLGLPTVIVAGAHAVAGLDLPPNVTLRSNLTIAECHDLCGRARVNVVPLRNTSFTSGQVTVLEAMMLGKAVVATRAAGTEDYVSEGENGLLVPPEDPAALAAAIAALWEDPAARARLGEAARRTVAEGTTFRSVAPAMAAVLDAARRRAAAEAGGVAAPGAPSRRPTG
ncbi:Glycosyltransferase involved in cell wall bisynthesis [Methylobacterium sp. 174MFSha1.1]|uniref:glycosyltransferase family 4 protein n=1 Tax=Methylobacterium sp. 174MFSha1.1 TaxID=1502749 RepID=UPI0008E51837|nr:glycosyltransferase family 4 protein [Methylobacterium sp. 174MFSha1.1]SFU87401.1 Glycosyltransferase involved in cell wall bisynthesis [Methylobacterium sp. 174MFSha1.1]